VSRIIGIDLGTTNSLVGFVDERSGLPRVIPDAEGRALLPSIVGFTLSSVMGMVLPGVPFIGGAMFTVGASAPIFGLLGAIVCYSRVTGSSLAGSQAWQYAIILFVFGLLPGTSVNNWAHGGGFVAGLLAGLFLSFSDRRDETAGERAIATANNPIGPHPITATGFVAMSSPPPVPNAACTALPNGSMIDAASGWIPSPTIQALAAGMTTYSANAPSMSTPKMRRFSQMCARPVRQVEQRPHEMWVSAATKTPGSRWCTSDPTRSTVPATSCPNVIGSRTIRFSAHSFQS